MRRRRGAVQQMPDRQCGVADGYDESRRTQRPPWCIRVPLVSSTALLFFLLGVPVAQAVGRVALVVGNSAYEHIGRLPNPTNDAADVGAALRRLGFDVTITRDAGLSALTGALRAFTRDSEGADVALVFYAGHGMEMDGVNYLLPVDARLERDTDVRYETVTLDDVLASTSGAGLRLVILDACRNNPLARSMRRTVRTRSVSNGSLGDLNEDLLGDETLVAYSAAAGTTADDGEGRNSPYASALLAHLEDPVDIGVMFRRVRARVLSATNERQRPHEYSSLLREHYLGDAVGGGVLAGPTASSEAALGLDRAARRVLQRRLAAAGFDPGAPDGMFGPATRASIRSWQASYGLSATGYLDPAQAEALRTGAPPRPAPVTAPAGGVVDPPPVVAGGLPDPVLAQQETVFWQSAANSTNAADVEAYLTRWPNGTYAVLARNRLEALWAEVADPPRPDPPAPASARPDPSRPVEAFRDCPSCPEMVVIPAGSFMMGSPAADEGRFDSEGPQHRVTVRSFALGVTEVTFDEWEACARGGGCNGYRPGDEGWGRGARPVINVNWENAQAYVSWLSSETGAAYRLPSESEWEYAARAGTTTPFHTGTTISTDQANYGFDHFETMPVRTFAPNAFGLYDMHGNVWEWVEDCWHGSYRGAPSDGKAWTVGGDCGDRVLRGGSWFYDPRFLRSAARLRNSTGYRDVIAGFRVARTLD